MTRTRSAVVVACAVLTALAAVAVGAKGDDWMAARAHDQARDRWESLEPAAYSFNFSYCNGFCPPCDVTITVSHGEVTDVAGRDDGCPRLRDASPTIEKVFDLVADIRDDSGTFEVVYDSYRGYPESADSACGQDCGRGLSVSDFEPLD